MVDCAMRVPIELGSSQVFDIGGAEKRLPNCAPFIAVKNAIRRRIEVGSARLDLNSASQKMAILASLGGRDSNVVEIEHQDDELALIGGSLFQHALLIYASVANSNDHRGAMKLTKGWTDDQLSKHSHLLDLRRKVVAHFGYGDHYTDGAWAMDRLFLVVGSHGQLTPVDYGQRTNYKQNDCMLLDETLPLAMIAIARITKERDEALHRLVTALAPADVAVFMNAIGDPIRSVENMPPEFFANLATPPRDIAHTLHPPKAPPCFGTDDSSS
jgi:hypothetical protein